MRIMIITQTVNTGTETKGFLLQTRCGLFLLLLLHNACFSDSQSLAEF